VTEKLLVTDTHPVVYFFCDGGRRLSKKARKAFENAVTNNQTAIFVPAAVLWEMSMLVENNDISVNMPFDEWVDTLFSYPSINVWPFDHETVKVLHNVRYHSDPFDRAIVASALQLGLPLVSNDSKMHEANPCALYWD